MKTHSEKRHERLMPGHDRVESQINSSDKSIALSTFALTEMVYDTLRAIPQSYLNYQVREAELVVLRSDRNLLQTALTQCLRELEIFSQKQAGAALFLIGISGGKSKGFIEISCPELDLTELSIRSGKNALNLTGREPAFGFVMAQMALNKVKAELNILINRAGGSRIVFEIPKVRGMAS